MNNYHDPKSIMQDGKPAWLNVAKTYYIRHERFVPHRYFEFKISIYRPFASRQDFIDNYNERTDRIVFYDLNGRRLYLCSGQCEDCKDFMQCRRLGHYIPCLCGKSGIDSGSWDPTGCRYIGNVKRIEKG